MRFFKAGDHFRHRVAAAGIGVFDRLQRAGHGDTKFTSLILGIGKKYDAVISGMYVTPERQKQADAIPYALSGASIIALKGGAVQSWTGSPPMRLSF
ncbi:extracellular solute-binding family protein 3 [Klebsiella pneumoniae]|nr:extracellular solute-binding family protein 3 [Klebsiella pneumoniae]